MRILKEGKKPEEVEKIKKCRRCNTIFTYTDKDLHEFGYDMDTWWYGIECPICKNRLEKSIFDRRAKND